MNEMEKNGPKEKKILFDVAIIVWIFAPKIAKKWFMHINCYIVCTWNWAVTYAWEMGFRKINKYALPSRHLHKFKNGGDPLRVE